MSASNTSTPVTEMWASPPARSSGTPGPSEAGRERAARTPRRRTLQGIAWVQSRQKRVTDLLVAAAVAPAAVPLAAAAGLAVACAHGRSPLFVQSRMGQGLRPLRVPKLRTLSGADTSAPARHGYHDPRARTVGRLVRQLHLDEVPQGLLIAAGRMSLVGPRPIVAAEVEMVLDALSPTERADWARARTLCKPGIVDRYSIRQHHPGYELDVRERAGADIAYLHEASFTDDLSILAESFLLSKADLFGLDVVARRGHPQAVDLLTTIARSFGVRVEDHDRRHWHAMFTAARVADDLVDRAGCRDLRGRIDDLLRDRRMAEMTAAEAAEFLEAFEALPGTAKAVVLDGARLDEFAVQRAQATDVPSLLAVVREEAELFAKIMHLATSPRNADASTSTAADTADTADTVSHTVSDWVSDTVTRERFNDWLLSFGRAGYCVDTFVDLGADYRHGLTRVTPTLRHRALVARHALPELWSCVRALSPATIASIVTAGIAKIIRGRLARLHGRHPDGAGTGSTARSPPSPFLPQHPTRGRGR